MQIRQRSLRLPGLRSRLNLLLQVELPLDLQLAVASFVRSSSPSLWRSQAIIGSDKL